MKLCKDCQQYTSPGHCSIVDIEPVNGQAVNPGALANRRDPNNCGPDARYFTSKTPKYEWHSYDTHLSYVSIASDLPVANVTWPTADKSDPRRYFVTFRQDNRRIFYGSLEAVKAFVEKEIQ